MPSRSGSGGRSVAGARAHVDPDDAAALAGRVRHGFDFGPEIRLGGLIGHVDAVAGGVELPAVVDAAQAGFFVAAEEQRGAAVRAVVLEQADLAVGIAEGDELFAEQHDAARVAVRLRQLAREQAWQPVLAHQLAHRRAGADATQQLVFFATQHLPYSLIGLYCRCATLPSCRGRRGQVMASRDVLRGRLTSKLDARRHSRRLNERSS